MKNQVKILTFVLSIKFKMKRAITHLLFLLFLLSAPVVFSQDRLNNAPKTELSFYPNPVSDGKIYITSTTATSSKEVEIFDILGKSILKASVVRELNISAISAGVYLIKIKSGDTSITRKLVIK